MAKCTAKVPWCTQTANAMKDSGISGSAMALVLTTTLMEADTKVNGWMIRFTAKENLSTPMEMSMKERYVGSHLLRINV